MKILLAVDGSRYTERALAYLAEHDEWLDPRHTYTVFHAVAPVPHPGAAFKDLATVQSLYTEDAEIVLKPVKDFFDKLEIKAAFMHEVGTAGSKIAHMAKTHNFDLLIMDVGLPDMDGREVFRRLKLDPSTARIPCIALSGEAAPEEIQAALAAGFAGYLTKPVDFDAFDQALDRIFCSPSAEHIDLPAGDAP